MMIMPVKPINDEELIYSSITDPEYTYYAPDTSIPVKNLGDIVQVGKYLYKVVPLPAGAGSSTTLTGITLPSGGYGTDIDWLGEGNICSATVQTAIDAKTTGLYWQVQGKSNKYRMFDGYVSTQSSASGLIQIIINRPGINAIYLFNIVVSSALFEVVDISSNVVWSYTADLYDGVDSLLDWYDYFFTPASAPKQSVKAILDYFPAATDNVRITLTGVGTVKIGVVAIGYRTNVGDVQWGVNFGIKDYSIKTTDATTGEIYVKEQAYAKTISAKALQLTADNIDPINYSLAQNRSTLCVYDCNEADKDLDSLVAVGYYSSYNLSLPSYNSQYCDFVIQGVI